MKAIVCEMCASNDVVKQDGFYVCQSCGTKYTPDDAKKLMVEIDNSEKLENYRKLARDARKTGDTEGAAKYYDLMRQLDPDDWEPYFYANYFKAASCKIAEITSAINLVTNSLPSTFEKLKALPLEEQNSAAREIADSCTSLGVSMHNAAQTHLSKYSSVSGTGEEYKERFYSILAMMEKLGDQYTATGRSELAFQSYQAAYMHYAKRYYANFFINDVAFVNRIVEKMKNADPVGYQKIEAEQKAQNDAKKADAKRAGIKILYILGALLGFLMIVGGFTSYPINVPIIIFGFVVTAAMLILLFKKKK